MKPVAILRLLPVLFWLAAQLVVTGAYAGTNAGTPLLTLPGQTTIVICTPTGFETIVVNADGQSTPPKSASHPCQWCQTFGSMPVLASTVQGVDIILTMTVVSLLSGQDSRVAGQFDGFGYNSRAPPPSV